MLRTRLWMGALLILLTLGVLLIDEQFSPWYPFLFVLILVLALAGCHELLTLLGPTRRPWPILCYPALFVLITVNWLPHVPEWPLEPDPWRWVLGSFAGVVLLALLAAMATFQPPGTNAAGSPDTLNQVALALFITAYLGVLPAFLIQLRWLGGERAVQAVALAIFLPKCCDVGAYTLGRLIGKHKMAPVLSPKKTWEGLAGGLALAALVAVILNRISEGRYGDLAAACLGLTVGGAGVLGDLAESLIKRECQQKDASQVMPGFGGVLDVIDSILYAAPVAYLWLA